MEAINPLEQQLNSKFRRNIAAALMSLENKHGDVNGNKLLNLYPCRLAVKREGFAVEKYLNALSSRPAFNDICAATPCMYF